jgi:hypothetical protein
VNLLQHLARIAAEMTMQRDPYPQQYNRPEILGRRRTGCSEIIEVKASTYRDVERLFEGVNVAGKSIIHTHTGRNRWEIHIEE